MNDSPKQKKIPTGDKNLEASIKAKGLTQDNYLQNLDAMTDEEITYMLDLSKDRTESSRKAQPNLTDRTYAEWLRAT